jgi:hypothetical protein
MIIVEIPFEYDFGLCLPLPSMIYIVNCLIILNRFFHHAVLFFRAFHVHRNSSAAGQNLNFSKSSSVSFLKSEPGILYFAVSGVLSIGLALF